MSSGGSSQADRDALWAGVAEAILTAPGVLSEESRRAIARGDDSPELAALLEKVRLHAYRIVDADVAGMDEDAVLEAVLAAALGVALDRRAAALSAVEEAE
jgi:arginine/ornithine N-succinyltransferase beta subunit